MTSPFAGDHVVIHRMEGMIYVCPHPIGFDRRISISDRHRRLYEAALIVLDARGRVCKNRYGETTADYPLELTTP